MGLNDVFYLIKSSLLSRENLLGVKDAFAIIFREESHRGIAPYSRSVTKPHVFGFVAKTNNWSINGNKRVDNNKKFRNSSNYDNNRGPNPNLLCKNYGKVEHTINRCFNLIGYPPGYNKNPRPKQNGYNKTFNANFASISNDNDDLTSSLSPYDDGIVSFAPNDDGNDQSCTRGFDTTDGSEVDFATSMGDNPSSEGNARLAAKGFSQREGFDYMETFSHVVKLSIVRCMLNVAMCNSLDLFQLDINNAFLYGDLSEDVYMTLPPGFDNQNGKVCKLNKSLYGLKQAPRQWNAKLTMALLENGFVQSKFDYSLFKKKFDKVLIALLIYVDDIVITGNDLADIEKFKMFLKSKFQINDLEKLKYFLGIKVLDNKKGICLSQRKYCLELSHEYGLLAAKHVDTPFPENTTLNHIKTSDDHLLDNIGNYHKLVGVKDLLPVVMYCDSSSALQIAANPIADVLTKALDIEKHKSLCVKLGMMDMFKVEKLEGGC
nr:ribonuclease H-like domain-containing protein [Tanacetum cinerariifolium]